MVHYLQRNGFPIYILARVMPECFGMGQAAGVAAALAAEHAGAHVGDVDLAAFHARLREQGVAFSRTP